jgi:restriction system protein
MQNNDLVAMPRKSVPSIAFGRITGSCEHRLGTNGESLYVHPVDWVKPDVPRTEIPAGVKGAITSFAGTACQVSAEAEGWVRSFMDGHTPPEDTELPPPVDVVAASRERISDFVGTVFHGHDLARLVEAIMQAEGYVTLSSSPGADGGVDILAGGGPLGFGSPRLCVQVKSGQAGSPVVDNLAGVMAKFGADHGLLVAWGGFTKAARDDARKQYFSLRLWDSDDLLDRLMAVYEQLNPNIQAELPLSRIWVLANDPSSF